MGAESGLYENVHMVKTLVEQFKNNNTKAPIEAIVAATLFPDLKETIAIIAAIKDSLHIKALNEVKEKMERGEDTREEIIAALAMVGI